MGGGRRGRPSYGSLSVLGDGRVIWAAGVHPVSKGDFNGLVPKHHGPAVDGSLTNIGQVGNLWQGQVLRSLSSPPGWGLLFSLHWPSLSHHQRGKGARAQSGRTNPPD